MTAGVDRPEIRGWERMARFASDELGEEIDERTLRRWAKRNKDPLPVYFDALGAVMHKSGFSEWSKRQVLPYQVHLREKSRAATKQHAGNVRECPPSN